MHIFIKKKTIKKLVGLLYCLSVCIDLEATKRRLVDSEREKSELALLAQQRLEEIEHLNR